jgi:hypothetical protein
LLGAGGIATAAKAGKTTAFETNQTFTNIVETNYVSNCVVSSTYTNMTYPGSISSSGPTVMPSPVCVGQPVTASVGSYYYSYAMHEVVTTYSGSNCPSSTDYYYSSPWVISESYTVSGPHSGSGSGNSVTFSPSSTGAGTVTFTVTYDDGTGNTESFQTATYYSVVNCTNVTNCAYAGTSTNCTPGSMTFDSADVYPATNCAGSSVSAYLGYSYYTPGWIEYITTYTGGCPPETNGYSTYPYVVDVTYEVRGPHSESGSGSSVWFSTTNTGSGSIVFTVTYDDGCGGLQTTTSSGSYTIVSCATNCVEAGTSTNCSPGSITYDDADVYPATNCVGETFSASLGYSYYTPGWLEYVTTYTGGTNCPPTTNSYAVYPYVIDVTYEVTGPHSETGWGSWVSFTPTNAGSGSIIFTVTYDDGCGGIQTATSSGSYTVNNCATNCIETSRQTNCLSEATVTLTGPTNTVKGCQSNSMSVSVTVSNTQGQIETVINYSNCPPTRTTNSYTPSLSSNWWVVSGVTASPSNGVGLTANFTPIGSGNGTVTFYQQYSNTPPCTGTGPASVGVSINVAARSVVTNCLTPPTMALKAGTNNVLTNCLNSPISASVSTSPTNGKVEIVTSYTPSNCPTTRVTNNVAPGIITNWWVATGPGGFTTNGSGLSASFTPTNVGNGSITFTVLYSNPPPCGTGTSMVTFTTNYHVYKLTLLPTNFMVCAGTTNVFTVSGGPGTNYVWNPVGTLNSTRTQNSIVFTNASTNQVVTVSYGGQCSVSVTGVVIKLEIQPTNFVTLTCITNTFTASGGPGTNYSWSPAGKVSANGQTNLVAFGSATANQVVTVSYGGMCPVQATGTVASATIIEVGFTGDHLIRQASLTDIAASTSGSPAGFEIDSPDGSKPVWTATTNLPVSYTRNAMPTFFGTLEINPVLPKPLAATIRVMWGTNELGRKAITIPANTNHAYFTGLASTMALTNAIAKSAYTFAWEITANGAPNFCPMGNSGPHTFYWTYAAPLRPTFRDATNGVSFDPVYVYALDKACTYANGETNASNAVFRVAAGIDGDISYDPSFGFGGGKHPLSAYTAACQCNDLAALLRGLIRTIGIDGDQIFIWAGPNGTTMRRYTYSGWTGPSFRVVRAAKDSCPANPHFTFHSVIRVGTTLFDAAYGSAYPSLSFDETANNTTPQQVQSLLYDTVNTAAWTCPH